MKITGISFLTMEVMNNEWNVIHHPNLGTSADTSSILKPTPTSPCFCPLTQPATQIQFSLVNYQNSRSQVLESIHFFLLFHPSISYALQVIYFFQDISFWFYLSLWSHSTLICLLFWDSSFNILSMCPNNFRMSVFPLCLY